MPGFKVNISDPKTGKTYKCEVAEDSIKPFLNLKIGDSVKGELLALPGYEFQLKGGSDYCGFPMRTDVQGSQKQSILIVSGVGMKRKRKGMRMRRTVAGNTVYSRTAQLNLKIVKHGSKPLEEPKKEVEAKPAEA